MHFVQGKHPRIQRFIEGLQSQQRLLMNDCRLSLQQEREEHNNATLPVSICPCLMRLRSCICLGLRCLDKERLCPRGEDQQRCRTAWYERFCEGGLNWAFQKKTQKRMCKPLQWNNIWATLRTHAVNVRKPQEHDQKVERFVRNDRKVNRFGRK